VGAFDGRSFTVTQPMTSLVGSTGEDFAVILRALGYRMDRRPPLPAAPAAAPVADAAAAPDANTAEEAVPEAVAVDVAHSLHVRDEMLKSGIKAEHLDGTTPQDDRDATLARLASGETEVVCNCMILTEGFDLPDLGCIVLARPTRSLGLFRQMIGRGLRTAPGKSDVIILDHSGGVHRHGRPDDTIEWTLDTDQRASNPAHEARLAEHHDPFCECQACGHLRMRGEGCGNCGWEPKRAGRAVAISTVTSSS
jgi:superfamily II DNA or RNA helicase